MRIRTIGRLGLVAAVLATLLVQTNGASADTPTLPGDGTTSPTAGASCWGIKQAYPASTDGIYWLNTAALGAPERYYCDMTTDGGGWVLIGRGRDGFRFDNQAQGSRAALREQVDGPGAFGPAVLAGDEIDRLLGNQPIESLQDGIRLRRATTIDGSNRQEIRLRPRTFGKWSWAFDGGILIDQISIDGVQYGKSNTMDTNQSFAGVASGLSGHNDEHRIDTRVTSAKAWKGGFALGDRYHRLLGPQIRGNNSATSYLWENGTERFPYGFTQIFVRPQIANNQAGFTALPAEGLPAEAQPARLKDRAEVAPWGVVGVDHTGEAQTEPWKVNAMAIHVRNNVVYVGGRFTGVQNGPGASPVPQPFLAAFDATTGAWIESFRPQLDGRVWEIDSTSDGKLIIGGDFTMVNGNTNATALAALDPATGAVNTSFKADIRTTGSARAIVRALKVTGNEIYAAGNFTHITGGTWAEIKVTRAVKVSAANGTPVSAWKPAPNGTVIDLDVTPDGSRVYLAGYFTSIAGDTQKGYFAGVNGTTGAPVPGQLPFTPSIGANAKYQQAVMVDGAHVYVGGSEHNIQKYRMSDNALVGHHITKQGGDTQALTRWQNEIVVGCHCGDAVYSDTNDYSGARDYSRLDAINLVGLFSADERFDYDTQWNPTGLKGDYGEGPWSFDTTSNGCLVMAGDFNQSGYSGVAANDWLGGFAKFCPQDSTPPTAPSNVSATVNGTAVTVRFTPGTDATPNVAHWVYRDDRVVGVTWGNSFVDPNITKVSRYTVRAVDDARNKSATANFVSVTPQLPETATLIAEGSTWSYNDSGVEAGGWTEASFDDSAWASGPARLGWNDPTAATVLGANLPTATYLRHTFTADETVDALRLRLLRDDGAVVYLNGVEIARSNLPAGSLTASTTASSYISGAAADAWTQFLVPGELLVAGENTIAVGLHQASAQNGDARFDLQLHALGRFQDADAPTAPALSLGIDTTGAKLTWTESTDESEVAYIISRDNEPVAVVGAGIGAWTDGNASAEGPHTWQVSAVDSHGNRSESNQASGTMLPDPRLISFGSEWAWRYNETVAPDAGWDAPGYDDSAWTRGTSEFGYGDNDEATVISTNPAPRPLVAQFRRTFNISDPSVFNSLVVNAIRDDGIYVTINGVEVGRENLPAGPVSHTTPAVTAITTRTAELAPVSFAVDPSVLVAGENTIAVSVHNSDRWSGDLSFNLALTGGF